MIYITQDQWNKTHQDYKGEVDGVKHILLRQHGATVSVPIEVMTIPKDAKIIKTSWGYDMTIVDYAVIIRETPKKVECVMIGKNGDNGYSGTCYPNKEIIASKKFMLCKRAGYDGKDCFVGSYPFCGGNDDSMRKGYFYIVDEKQGSYYNHMN